MPEKTEKKMPWELTNLLTAAALVAIAIGAYNLLSLHSTGPNFLMASVLALLTGLALVWTTLALGVIGAPDNPANLLYGLIFLAILAGAIKTRFRPEGMAHVMLVAAALQALIAILAFAFLWGSTAHAWPADILIASALFTIAWLIAGRLFHEAALKAGDVEDAPPAHRA